MPSTTMASGSGSKPEFLVNLKYRLVRKIGSGSFGDIYLGINVSNGEVCSYFKNNIKFKKYLLIILHYFLLIINIYKFQFIKKNIINILLKHKY